MSTPVKVIGMLTARPGKEAELQELLDGMVSKSRNETGNLRYDLWVDQSEPTRFVLDELYEDGAANSAHRESPHFQNYLSRIGDLAERSAVALDPVEVA